MGIGFVVACPLESYKNSKEMRGAVSPLRVTLILIVPHLQLKRTGIQSLSGRTGSTSTYILASTIGYFTPDTYGFPVISTL